MLHYSTFLIKPRSIWTWYNFWIIIRAQNLPSSTFEQFEGVAIALINFLRIPVYVYGTVVRNGNNFMITTSGIMHDCGNEWHPCWYDKHLPVSKWHNTSILPVNDIILGHKSVQVCFYMVS